MKLRYSGPAYTSTGSRKSALGVSTLSPHVTLSDSKGGERQPNCRREPCEAARCVGAPTWRGAAVALACGTLLTVATGPGHT